MNNYTFGASSEAVNQLKLALDKRNTPKAVLRIGVRGSGCSGMMYHLEFCDNNPRETDSIFTFQNVEDNTEVKIIIDYKSIIYLTGSELVWEKEMMHWGFKIANPRAKNECGCKVSFSI